MMSRPSDIDTVPFGQRLQGMVNAINDFGFIDLKFVYDKIKTLNQGKSMSIA